MLNHFKEYWGAYIIVSIVVIVFSALVASTLGDNDFSDRCEDSKGVVFRRYPTGGLVCLVDYRIIAKR